MKKALLLFLLVVCSTALGQYYPPVAVAAQNPSGQFVTVSLDSGGNLYTNGAGSAVAASTLSGFVPPSAMTAQGPSGTPVYLKADVNGNLFVTSSSGNPSVAALAALPTGAHGFSCDESSTAGVPAANVDYLRCDSVTHKILGSYNGGAELPELTGATSTQMVLPFAASPTSGTVALTAINVLNLGTVFQVPPQGLLISHIAVSLSTQDATGGHLYDLCIYSINGTTGTLSAHIGATAFSSQFANSFAISGAPITLPGGTYITAWTGNAITAAMFAPWAGTNSTVMSPYGEGTANTTTGGVCGNTITLSAQSYQTTVQPGGWLLF